MKGEASIREQQTASPSPWRVPIFRRVWAANLLSNFGTVVQSVGASWMMLSLSDSAIHVALVQSSMTLPIMLLALVAGALADNVDRRLVMLAAQFVMLAAAAGLTACAAFGLLTPWLLLAFTFAIGCGTALNGPAWQASVGDMVPRPALSGAIALNSMGFNIARSLGPALGGVIVAAAGAAAAFLVNALSYTGLIAVLLRWRTEPEQRALPREGLGSAVAAGLRYVAMSPALRLILLRAALFGLVTSSIMALLPLVARDMVVGGPLTFGLLLGAFGVGSVGGALGSGWVRRHLSTEWIVRTASLAMAFALGVAGMSRLMPLTMFVLIFAGAGWVLALSTFNASVQLGSPRWVVARAVAMYQVVTFGGMAVGSWTFGALAEYRGVAFALLTAAGLMLLTLLAGMLKPLPETEGENLDLIGRWTEPETAVPVTRRTGPVVVTIDYQIAPRNVIAFLTAMDERRRIRLRDGARHWRLLRDLGDERHWIERYQVPTWLDYVRHNQRRTQADLASMERIRALHEGPWPPVVHRMIERQTGTSPGVGEPPISTLSPPLTDPMKYS